MTAPAKKTDTHAIVPATVHGPGVYSVINRVTGEEVDRVASFGEALDAQKKYDARVRQAGQ